MDAMYMKAIFGLGPMELVIILIIILIIFGAGKLPEIGGGMGKAIRNFKSGIKENEEIPAEKIKEKAEPSDEA